MKRNTTEVRDLVLVTIVLNDNAIPEFMPRAMADGFADAVLAEVREFETRVGKIREDYESRMERHLGTRVLPLGGK